MLAIQTQIFGTLYVKKWFMKLDIYNVSILRSNANMAFKPLVFRIYEIHPWS